MQSSSKYSDDGVAINLSDEEIVQIEKEDKRKLLMKLIEDWRAGSHKGFDESIQRIKGVYVKKIRLSLKLLMDELTDIISR
jgi:hypothetical protein